MNLASTIRNSQMSAGTVPDRRNGSPSWRVAALGFSLSLTATTALALGLSAL
jgi:hypothetical protein